MIGVTCVDCRAKHVAEDAPSLAVIAARAVWPKKVASREQKR